MNYLVFDVGGTFIKYALMKEDAIILEQGKIPTPYGGLDDFVQALAGIRHKFPEVVDIALSLPGTLDAQSGYVYQGGSLTYNAKVNMKEVLEAALHAHVALENDARCACLAEMWKGNLQGVEQGVTLTFGTGVGGSFVINGELYKGSHFFSGEVSMLLMKDIREVGLKGVWGSIGSVTGLVRSICEAKGVELQDGPTVFSWIHEGDETAVSLFQEYCYQIVTQLFNLQIILDPTTICIGGGASANPIFVKTIQQCMEAFYASLPFTMPHVSILPCKFHNDSNLIGAMYHYIKQKEQVYE